MAINTNNIPCEETWGECEDNEDGPHECGGFQDGHQYHECGICGDNE